MVPCGRVYSSPIRLQLALSALAHTVFSLLGWGLGEITAPLGSLAPPWMTDAPAKGPPEAPCSFLIWRVDQDFRINRAKLLPAVNVAAAAATQHTPATAMPAFACGSVM